MNNFYESKKIDEQFLFIGLCFFVFADEVFIGWILSIIIRPIFVERYMYEYV